MSTTDPRIVIAGSRALDGGAAPRLLVNFLARIPAKSTILLRQPLRGFPGIFESQVEELCDLLGIAYEYRQPQAGVGREATFARDLSMIDESDLVLTFVLPQQVGDEHSGTTALAEKALEGEKCVYSYAVDSGGAELIGCWDPDDEWGPMLRGA